MEGAGCCSARTLLAILLNSKTGRLAVLVSRVLAGRENVGRDVGRTGAPVVSGGAMKAAVRGNFVHLMPPQNRCDGGITRAGLALQLNVRG